MSLIDNIQMKLIFFTIIIHMIDTLSYCVRLNSIKNGTYALSNSLFNIFVLISRTANMFQAPLIGALIDISIKTDYNPIFEVRNVIFAATIGTLTGIVFIPTFLSLFSKAVSRLEITGSIPGLVLQALSIGNIKRIAKNTKTPKKSMISGMRFKNIPKRLLLLNAVITGIYSVGVLAAYYAAVYIPEQRLAVSASSGMINGVATILFTVFVDPRAALIVDEVRLNRRPYGDAKALVILLIGTKLIGTLLGQILIIPAAKILAFIYT